MATRPVRKPGHLKLRLRNLEQHPQPSYEYCNNSNAWKLGKLDGLLNSFNTDSWQPEDDPWFISAESAIAAAKVMPMALKIVDWNVLFDHYHLEKIYQPLGVWTDPFERYHSILETILDLDGDVVCLQEVTNVFLEFIQLDKRTRERYACSHVPFLDSPSLVPYSQVILVKRMFAPFRCRSYRYDRNGDKQAVIADLVFQSSNALFTMSIASIHLQAGEPTPDIMGMRRVTLHSAMRLVHEAALAPELHSQHSAIVAGDFNYGPESPENACLYDWITAWNANHGPQTEFTGFVDTHAQLNQLTVDSDTNTLTKLMYPGEEPKRLDRILIKSDVWKAASCSVVTAEREAKFPSDHFACTTTLRHSNTKL